MTERRYPERLKQYLYPRFYLLLIFFGILFKPYSLKGQNANPFTLSVLLEYSFNGKISFGTGFLIADSTEIGTSIYVVTARHVLGDLDNKGMLKLKSSKLKLLRSNDLKSNKYSYMLINIENLMKAGLVMWNKKYDVALVHLAILKNNKQYMATESDHISFFTSFAREHIVFDRKILKSISQINVASDIYVSGYPKTIGLVKNPQFDYNKPLVRQGIVSGFNPDKKTIILDIQSFGGYSGSPVYHRSQNNKMNIIGIIVEKIPYIDNKKSNSGDLDNSGFSVAVSSDLIVELLNEFKSYLDTIDLNFKSRTKN